MYAFVCDTVCVAFNVRGLNARTVHEDVDLCGGFAGKPDKYRTLKVSLETILSRYPRIAADVTIKAAELKSFIILAWSYFPYVVPYVWCESENARTKANYLMLGRNK